MRSRPLHWNPPGPPPAGDGGEPDLRPGPGETLDCLSGHWKIFQLRGGHRYSTDDLLTAWYAADGARGLSIEPQTLLDLGCGIGSVALLLAWRFPRLRVTGVEAQVESAALARRSARYNGAADRIAIHEGDLRTFAAPTGRASFDLVTGSPPYLLPSEGRRSLGPQRGPCRFEDRGGVRGYLAAAARHLRPEGLVAWVHAARYRDANLEAAREAGLGNLEWRPVVFREGRTPVIAVFRARRGGWTQPGEGPPLFVRREDGEFSEEYRRVRDEMGFPA